MIETLKFVQGAVAKKDFVPALTHFHIADGQIQGFNGGLAISSPIDLDIEAMPRAIPFVKAIQGCSDDVSITKTKQGRVSIKSGKFRAFVDCTEELFPVVKPEGVIIPLERGLLSTLLKLAPFIAQDASRPWATGILFKDGSAFATNNIVAVEQWLGYDFPEEVNIPVAAVKELLRIKEEPTSLQMNNNSVTFHFSGDRWIRTQLSSLKWPDMTAIFKPLSKKQNIPVGFFDAIESLLPFVDEHEKIFVMDNVLATSMTDGQGASVEIDGLIGQSCFRAKQLLSLRDVIHDLDLTQYPSPCPFRGDDFRGVILGMVI